jgi:superfamily II DNA or RNA helicase
MNEQNEEEKKYLSKRGYVIKKKFLTQNEIKMIVNDLTVKPFVSNDYGEEQPFKIYLENTNKYYVPKFYGLEKFGCPITNTISPGMDIDLAFTMQLKTEQIEPAEKTMEAYSKNGGGILALPCGFGKTILALYFISQLKKKTLVIVHKEFLMNQWIERVKMALPTAKIGIIQGDKFQTQGNDIVIGMLQTLSMKEFNANVFDDFGHVIIDECHTISSRVFSQALFKINAPYMLGISATPTRNDGLMKVLKYHIGEVFYTIKSNERNIVKVERYLLESNEENYKDEVLNYKQSPQIATMLNNIAAFYKRSKLIVDRVIDEIKSNETRQFLILSDRKNQLETMHTIIQEYNKNNEPITVGYYIGGLKKSVLKENESCRILLGTYPMASTGLDIPTLNGLVLATPRSDIIQSIGRIDRIVHINIQPLIIDICDMFSLFETQARKRFGVYKKKSYLITDIKYNVDRMIELFKINHPRIVAKNSCHKNESDREEDELVVGDHDEIDPKTYKKKFVAKGGDSKMTEDQKQKKTIDELFNSRSLFS